MSDKTTYIIKNIDKDKWKEFRAICLLKGYSSAGALLREIIYDYSNTSK